MGCGCGQKRLPRTTRTAAAQPSVGNKTYRNDTDRRLVARIPRISLEPGETIDLKLGSISYTVRTWIRNGALVEA